MIRQRRETAVEMIRSCKGQMENVIAVAQRTEEGDKRGLAVDILKSCLGELESAVEMVKKI